MVPSHRQCGFAAEAALFPVCGLDFSKSHSKQRVVASETKLRPG